MFCRNCQTQDYCYAYTCCALARLPLDAAAAPAGDDACHSNRQAGASHQDGAEGATLSDQKFDGVAA
jgi:hypothetical protein